MHLWVEHDFNAAIFLVTKGLVSGWRFLKGKAMSNDEGWIDSARIDLFQ